MLQELNELCNIIVEPLRDRVVTSLLQASLVWFLSHHALPATSAASSTFLRTDTLFFLGWLSPCYTEWRPVSGFFPKRCQITRRGLRGAGGNEPQSSERINLSPPRAFSFVWWKNLLYSYSHFSLGFCRSSLSREEMDFLEVLSKTNWLVFIK